MCADWPISSLLSWGGEQHSVLTYPVLLSLLSLLSPTYPSPQDEILLRSIHLYLYLHFYCHIKIHVSDASEVLHFSQGFISLYAKRQWPHGPNGPDLASHFFLGILINFGKKLRGHLFPLQSLLSSGLPHSCLGI